LKKLEGVIEMSEEISAEEKKPSEATMQDVMARLEALEQEKNKLESTNQRLLEESKKYKESYKAVKTEQEKAIESKLLEEKNYEELLKIERDRAKKLEEQTLSMKKSSIQKDLRFQVAQFADGAYDIEDIVSNLPRDILSVDQENLKIENVQEAVSKVRETKPYLFNAAKSTGMMGGKPSTDLGKEPSIDEMSRSDKIDLLAKLL
jgi:HD superfamily phosphohydrolase